MQNESNLSQNPKKPRRPTVFVNSGAGAVGKTSVVLKALEYADAYGLKIISVPSTTRQVYAALGISTEKAATEMSTEEQFHLQEAIHNSYYENTAKFIRENQDVDVIMIDRSPYDHVSYQLHNMARHLTLKDVQEDLKRAHQFMLLIVQNASQTILMQYKFPDYWHTYETESSDGFRYDSGGKNFLWASALASMWQEADVEVTKLMMETSVQTPNGAFNVIGWPMPNMGIEERARFLLKMVRPRA
jgi:Ni2+-binding GTPase involved in maturation of urease and hydrogenase